MMLKKTVTRGLRWSSISQVGRQIVQLLTTVILAHLLLPSDFGLVGMSMVIIGFVTLFKDLGTSAVVVQRQEMSDSLLSSIYWANVAFGLISTIAVLALSPLAGWLFNEPRIVPLVRVLSLTFFISGFSLIYQSLLQKDMSFDVLTKVELLSLIVGAFVGISLAFLGAGVWSLVYQSLAIVTTTSISLWLSCRWRPQRLLRLDELRSITHYSLNLTGYNIFNYMARNADSLLIGRFLGAQNLGYYTLAYRIMLYPIQNISSVVMKVMFPAFSQIQDDNARFRDAYLKVIGTLSIVTFSIMAGLAVLSEPIVDIVFGEKWQPIVVLIIIFAPVGMVQSIGTTVGMIYQAKGRTDIMFRWGMFVGILMISGFVVGLYWGIVGVALVYAIVTLIVAYHNFLIPFRLINLPIKSFVAILLKPLFSSLLIATVLFIANTGLTTFVSGEVLLGALLCIGIISWLVINIIFNSTPLRLFWDTFRS